MSRPWAEAGTTATFPVLRKSRANLQGSTTNNRNKQEGGGNTKGICTEHLALDAQMCAHDFVCEFADLALGNSATVGQYAELARYAASERKLLLDQKHGQSFFLIQPQNNIANFVDNIWLDPFSRLIENQQLRLENERPADRELLLLTARKVAATPIQHLL